MDKESAKNYYHLLLRDILSLSKEFLEELLSEPVSEENLGKLGFVNGAFEILLNNKLTAKCINNVDGAKKQIKYDFESVLERYEKQLGYKRIILPLTHSDVFDLMS